MPAIHRGTTPDPCLHEDTREKAFTARFAQADAEGDLDRVVAVDSTIVRAQQPAAAARQPQTPRKSMSPVD